MSRPTPETADAPISLSADCDDDLLYRTLMEQATDGIFICDPQGRHLMVNSAGCRMLGYSRDELLRLSIQDTYIEEELAVAEQRISELRQGKTLRFERAMRRKDGSRFDVEISAAILANGLIQGIVRDISQRKRIDEEYRQQMQRQLLVAQFGGRALVERDLGALMEEAAQLVSRELKTDYCKVLELLPDGSHLLLRAGVGWPDGLVGEAKVDTGFDSQAGYTLRSKRPVIVEDLRTESRFRGPPLLRDCGVVSGLSVIIHGYEGPFGVLGAHTRAPRIFTDRDVHFFQSIANVLAAAVERNRAEATLRESEARFRTLADNIAQFAWMADPSGWIFWYNKRWFEYTGTTMAEMRGWGWQRVHHPDHVRRVTHKFKISVESGADWEDTFPLRGKDGEYRWFLSRAIAVRDPQGKILRWFGTNTDITERLAAENELERRVQERTASLRDAIDQMEEFSYSVSHDLRAPVRAMQGYARALEEDYGHELDPAALEYLDRIVRSGARMDRLIQDVLTYSRLSRREIQIQPVALDRLVREIIQQYPEMQPPRAQVAVQAPLGEVLAHEPSLSQALSNLLSNAVKFVPPEVLPCVVIRTEPRQGRVRLWITDNGIGIRPEFQPRLFGMFERIHPETKYEGTGIGLAIVRKAVERMGGQVGMESDGVSGSKFWIQLPAA